MTPDKEAEKKDWLRLWDSYNQHLPDNETILEHMCGQLMVAAVERGMSIVEVCRVMSERAIEAAEDDDIIIPP
jgi:hypothetical protein